MNLPTWHHPRNAANPPQTPADMLLRNMRASTRKCAECDQIRRQGDDPVLGRRGLQSTDRDPFLSPRFAQSAMARRALCNAVLSPRSAHFYRRFSCTIRQAPSGVPQRPSPDEISFHFLPSSLSGSPSCGAIGIGAVCFCRASRDGLFLCTRSRAGCSGAETSFCLVLGIFGFG